MLGCAKNLGCESSSVTSPLWRNKTNDNMTIMSFSPSELNFWICFWIRLHLTSLATCDNREQVWKNANSLFTREWRFNRCRCRGTQKIEIYTVDGFIQFLNNWDLLKEGYKKKANIWQLYHPRRVCASLSSIGSTIMFVEFMIDRERPGNQQKHNSVIHISNIKNLWTDYRASKNRSVNGQCLVKNGYCRRVKSLDGLSFSPIITWLKKCTAAGSA